MKTKHYFFYACTLVFSQLAFSQNKTSIDGVWKDDNNGVSNAVAIFSEQDNNQIVFTHYLEWKGQKFIESGIGKREGNVIICKVKVTTPIEGWATEGVHTLTISEDGKSLNGTYSDNKSRSGSLSFIKMR